MKQIANAKINLALNVIRRREDGYHELESIMLPLSFGDEVSVEEADNDTLTSNVDYLPLDESNLAMKALRLMQREFDIKKHYHIHIEKRIPSEAGLGGGSADGAAVLRLIRNNEKLDVSDEKLAELSVKLGADCPFCVMNKPMLISGIGEKHKTINLANFPLHVLLVKPASGVSTKLAYETLNIDKADHPNCNEIIDKMLKGNFKELAISNSLEESALRINDDIKVLKDELKQDGFEYVLMSGSGSCVFALSEKEELLVKSIEKYQEKYVFVEKCEIICANDLNF